MYCSRDDGSPTCTEAERQTGRDTKVQPTPVCEGGSQADSPDHACCSAHAPPDLAHPPTPTPAATTMHSLTHSLPPAHATLQQHSPALTHT
jgi:hypothetical protein